MVFNGLPIWFATIIAIAGIGTLIVSHLLKMRQKNVVVPTTLFWQQAIEASKRNIILGRLSAIMTLLFLTMVVIFMVFSMVSPAIAPLDTKIVIIDVCPATDLNLALKHARSLIRRSDHSVLMTVGEDIKVHANIYSNPQQTALASINSIIESPSMYSGLEQAINEARSINQSSEIIVLTGQEINIPEDIQVFLCPGYRDLSNIVPLKVAFPEDFRLQGMIYCQADERFEYCEDTSEADVVLDGSNEFLMENGDDSGFVEMFSRKIVTRAGLSYRRPVSKANTSQTGTGLPVSVGRKLEKVLYGTVFLFLLLEIYLVKKHKLI